MGFIRSVNFSAQGGVLTGLLNVEVPGKAMVETIAQQKIRPHFKAGFAFDRMIVKSPC